MKSLMEGLGLNVKVMEGFEGKPNVVGLWAGTDPEGPTLLVDGHMDVVPAGDGWDVDPWAAEIRDGAIWGRGSADMKHALAITASVIRALKQAGFTPRGNLLFSATVDDETAGLFGSKYVIEEGLKLAGWPRPAFHLLLEPTNWDVDVAFKGRVWIKITVKGKSAHGGSPEKGVSAIVKMMELTRRLFAMERHTHPLMPADTLNIGTIEGGEKTNIVPESCTATFDYRFVSPCSSDQAIQRFQDVISDMERTDPDFHVSEFSWFEKRDPTETDLKAPALNLLCDCIKDYSDRPGRLAGSLSAGNTYWSMRQGGRIAMSGPGDPSIIHTNKECIPIKDLVEGARIVAAFVVRFLG